MGVNENPHWPPSLLREPLVPSVPFSSFMAPVSWFSVHLPFLSVSPQVRGLYPRTGDLCRCPRALLRTSGFSVSGVNSTSMSLRLF